MLKPLLTARHHPRKRAIQYAAASRSIMAALEYWVARSSRAMTAAGGAPELHWRGRPRWLGPARPAHHALVARRAKIGTRAIRAASSQNAALRPMALDTKPIAAGPTRMPA